MIQYGFGRVLICMFVILFYLFLKLCVCVCADVLRDAL